jgi:hypothetical protein
MPHGDSGAGGRRGGNFFGATLHHRIGRDFRGQNIRADASNWDFSVEARRVGEFAVDVRKAAVIEERTFPRDDRRLDFFCGSAPGIFAMRASNSAAEFFERTQHFDRRPRLDENPVGRIFPGDEVGAFQRFKNQRGNFGERGKSFRPRIRADESGALADALHLAVKVSLRASTQPGKAPDIPSPRRARQESPAQNRATGCAR